MDFVLSEHAFKQIARRQIPEPLLRRLLDEPQQVVPAKRGRRTYQSVVTIQGRRVILRAFVIERTTPPTVASVYYSSKIKKYWQSEGDDR